MATLYFSVTGIVLLLLHLFLSHVVVAWCVFSGAWASGVVVGTLYPPSCWLPGELHTCLEAKPALGLPTGTRGRHHGHIFSELVWVGMVLGWGTQLVVFIMARLL